MPSKSPFLLLISGTIAALLIAAPATAQWAWRDASGKMVFSDRAPPKSVPPKDVVRQPQTSTEPRYAAPPAPAQAEGAEPPKAVTLESKAVVKSTAAKTLAEREMESRLRKQQLAEVQKKADAEEQRKAQIADNCDRMRGYQRALNDGMRIGRVNAAGEREILDDNARAAEIERVRGQIEQHCR